LEGVEGNVFSSSKLKNLYKSCSEARLSSLTYSICLIIFYVCIMALGQGKV